MGAKQSKIEGTYLPDTPVLKKLSQSHPICVGEATFNEVDPRSPGTFRTPISIVKHEKYISSQQPGTHGVDNTFISLGKKIFKGFSCNLNDPRSPALNRTPLPIEDLKEHTFNLDDTFANLFIESRAPFELLPKSLPPMEHEDCIDTTEPIVENLSSLKQVSEDEMNLGRNCEKYCDEKDNCIEINSFVYHDSETMECPAIMKNIPVILNPPKSSQTEWDPRSPSLGIERTPIILEDDDDETVENFLLESVLATLSMDLSNASSTYSFSTPTGEKMYDVEAIQGKPTNKHLNRARNGTSSKIQARREKRFQQQQIYEDNENITPLTTPNRKPLTQVNSGKKRTPLLCVKNQSYMRSRSVEPSGITLKTKLTLNSFDDFLNPVHSAKVAKLDLTPN